MYEKASDNTGGIFMPGVSCGCFFILFDGGAYTPIKAVIPISCLKVSDSGASTYEIQIEQESPDAPMPNEKAIQAAQNGKGSKLDGVDFKNEAAAEHTQTTPTPVVSKTDVNPTTGNTAGKSLYAKILKITMLLLVSIAAVSLIIGRESERGEESAQD